MAGKPQYRAELKYSLISLKAELDPSRARIVVASDTPEVYRAWPVTVMDIASRIREWSGGGLYYHRIKPALVREALERFAEPVLFLDSDSIVRPGFHAEAEEKMAASVVMNRFEKNNPFPPLKGFRTRLPHLGAYRYDVAHSWMFNSGLIGMKPEHLPLLDDALAMIDALIGRAKKFPAIEQFALSEVLRLSQTPIAEIHDTFPALLAGPAADLYGEPDRQNIVARLGRSRPRPGNGPRWIIGRCAPIIIITASPMCWSMFE